MTDSPQSIATHLLGVLLTAVKEMPLDVQHERIDQETLIVGMAEALGDLLSSVSRAQAEALMPKVLEKIISTTGGTVVLARSMPPEESMH